MDDTKLVVLNNPNYNANRLCIDCRYFHPNIDYFGYEPRSFSDWWNNTPRRPTSYAIEFARCDAYLTYANLSRRHCDGKTWKPKNDY